MQWLLTLESERDPIVLCRLMNIFRRKGVSIETMALASKPEGYALTAVVDTAESEIDHIFNFLRRTEGVSNVACYRHEPSAAASFLFVESDTNPKNLQRFLETFPESKVIFASHGKHLFEVGSASQLPPDFAGLGESGFLPLSRFKMSREHSQIELVGAISS